MRHLAVPVNRQRNGERGQSLILFAFMIMAMVGLAALTIDVGMAYHDKANSRKAADAAALAAARVLFTNGGADAAIDEALEVAAANGYVDGENDVDVSVHIPPVSGPFAGRSQHVQVEIDSSRDTKFASVLGVTAFDVKARSVAAGVSSGGAYGIIALNPHACKAFDLNGTIDIYIRAAGIFVNSDCPTDAFWANGNVEVDTLVNSVVGGWSGTGNISINPTPTSAAPITDPLAGLMPPTPPTNVQACPNSWSGTITLQPGRYECTIDPSGPRSVIFAPGNYHITGGVVANGGGNITFGAGEYTLGGVGIQVTGSGRITVNEAVLYIESGEVELTGNGVTRLTAPTTGPYKDISIFQARNNTTQVDLKGTSLTSGTGVIYAPAAHVQLVGTSDSNNMQIVCDTFGMSGNAGLTLDDEDGVMVQQSYLRLVE